MQTVTEEIRTGYDRVPRIPHPGEFAIAERDGVVTLKGQVAHQYHSDAAFDAVFRLPGVGGVTNEIKVVTAGGH